MRTSTSDYVSMGQNSITIFLDKARERRRGRRIEYTADEPTGTRNTVYGNCREFYVGRLEGAPEVADCIRGIVGVVTPPLGTWKIVASSSVLITIQSPI